MNNRLTRHATARSALDVVAIIFLVCSIAFWGVLHYSALVVPAPYIPQAIVALVMTLIYALALPLLLSMLVPTTPAGQMLQKTQWRTIGFPVIIASALFLAWHARNLMLFWFMAQPAISEAGQEMAYTIAALIGFVVIPALCWVQVTPERWLQQIQQAHAVKKLEMMQAGELAIIKNRLLWAEQKAAVSFANLLPAEQKEVVDTIAGLFKAMNDQQKSIVRTLGLSADLERDLMDDETIASEMDYVAQHLASRSFTTPALSSPDTMSAKDRSRTSVPHSNQDTNASANGERERSRSATVPPRTTNANANDTLIAARRAMGDKLWTRADLEDALSIQKTKAAEYIKAWRQSGDVVDISDPAYHYQFVEG